MNLELIDESNVAERQSRRRIYTNKIGLILGTMVISGMILAAFFLPLPHDPFRPDPWTTLSAPSAAHWFGTDRFGFDLFSRVIIAARLDLPLAIGGAA